MSYLVFARKWRPQIFEEVVGQEHVTTTLTNAILSNRVAHAYLFSGPRGVGKTTTARIFAKALNCQSSDKPTITPCNKCEACLEITEGRSLDVIEIDGASNRGIEEIRQLRENVKFGPSKGRYKVYIIDEVHQITQDGFNALLKTLEEPPAYVKFIFATTHKHKIIPTILSRCQRFDFKKVPTTQLVEKLKSISTSENVKIDEDALYAIARSADGSVRDAESVLDQVVSFSRGKISTEDVVSMLGSIEQEAFFEITRVIMDKDAEAGLKLINKFVNDGKDLYQFVSGLLEHFRNLAIAKVQAQPAGLIDLPKDAIDKIYKQSKELELADIIFFFNSLNTTQELMRKSGFARMQLEITIIKLIKRDAQKSAPAQPRSAVIGTARAVASQVVESPKVVMPGPINNAVVDVAPDLDYVLSSLQEPDVAVAVEEKPQAVSKAVGVIRQGIPLIEDVRSAWQYVINGVKSEKISAALFLMEGLPGRMEGAVVFIDFPQKYVFYKEALERNENRCIIEKYLKSALNSDIKVKFSIVESMPVSIEAKPEKEVKPVVEVKPAAASAVGKNNKPTDHAEPIVQSAIDIFRARVIKKG